MKVRKLRKEEHIRTRKLWEEIFTEDTSEFLDYYYSVKTAESEIYVMEDQDEIVSMLHLNPYQMRIRDKVYQTHYIVGVATDVRYRRRGLMAQLLNHVVQVMKDRGEPFTFLMPASEDIYKPFGFEFVYTQGRTYVAGVSGPKVLGKHCSADASANAENYEIAFIHAQEKDCKDMAEFANDHLKSYDVTTWRTERYYKTMLAEKISENGGILLAKQSGKIVGVFCFENEGQLEIQEALFGDKNLLQQAIYCLTGNETEEVLCIGVGEQEMKPMIMAKILHPELVGDLQTAKVFLNEEV